MMVCNWGCLPYVILSPMELTGEWQNWHTPAFHLCQLPSIKYWGFALRETLNKSLHEARLVFA